jgi:hypothetical protein
MIHHLGERDGIMYSVQYQIIIIAGCRTSQPPLFNCSVVVSYRAFGRLLLCTSPGVLEIGLGRAAFRSVDTQHARPADAEKSSRALMQPAPNSVPLSQSFTLLYAALTAEYQHGLMIVFIPILESHHQWCLILPLSLGKNPSACSSLSFHKLSRETIFPLGDARTSACLCSFSPARASLLDLFSPDLPSAKTRGSDEQKHSPYSCPSGTSPS